MNKWIIAPFIFLLNFSPVKADSGFCDVVSKGAGLFLKYGLVVSPTQTDSIFHTHEAYISAYEFLLDEESIALPPQVRSILREQYPNFLKLSTIATQWSQCFKSDDEVQVLSAFTISLTAFADFFVGGIYASEFLFFPAPDGRFHIIQYDVKGGRLGVSAQVGAEVTLGFVYGLEKPEDYSGGFVGIGADIEAAIGAGVSYYSGVPNISFDRLADRAYLEQIIFNQKNPTAIVFSGNIGAGGGFNGSYTKYREVFRYNRLLDLH